MYGVKFLMCQGRKKIPNTVVFTYNYSLEVKYFRLLKGLGIYVSDSETKSGI